MKIRYNRANVYKCGDLILMPGVNTIDEKVWAKVAKNPGVMSRVEMGAIVVSEAAEAPKRGRKPKDADAPADNDADNEGAPE